MAKFSSIIRYKFKADRDFESVQFEGMSCSLGELKRLILDKSSRTGSHHFKDDYDLTIKDAMIDREYKDYHELIPRNTSVIVTRRIRGSYEPLTTSSCQKSVDTTSEIVDKYLRPVIQQTEIQNESNQNEEMSEDERIKKLLEDSKLNYLPGQRVQMIPTCHNCRQTGHLKNQCPLILQQNNINGTTSSSSSVPPPPSRIITTQAPYQMSNPHPYHHHYHRHRYPRVDFRPKNPTGLPKNDLIQIPRHIPGAFRDQTGASVVPIGVARMLIEDSQKKADALAQRTRNPIQEKSLSTTKPNENENPPDDLLCPICKEIFRDAVITPCCHQNFCDECIRNALLESDDFECPHCHRQSVAMDEINPHLLLRKHVDRWREEQQQKISTFSYTSIPTVTTTNVDESISNIDDFVQSEFDFHSSIPQQPSTTLVSIPTGPIVIKMQTSTQLVSSSIVNTQPSDVILEDDKAPETNQVTHTENKDFNVEKSPKNDEDSLTINDILSSVNSSETEKSSRQTPPSQVAPVSTSVLSSPTTVTTAISGTSSLVPHHPYLHSQPIPSVAATGLYPMAANFYGSPIHVPYPGAPPHHHLIAPPSMLPVTGPPGFIPHYTGYPPYPGMAAPHHPMALTHLPPNPMSGYHFGPYETTNVTDFHHSTTSTLISNPHHHQQQNILLTKDEFEMKQRDLRRKKRSSSNNRSRSYSSSSSSSGSNDSRRRRHHQHQRHHTSDRYRRSSRSRTSSHRHRSRYRSPSSNSTRRHNPAPEKIERVPSKQQRLDEFHHSSNRSTRNRERRRSPRPPPTIQQSTQRTIVYSHETSTKASSSRDDRKAPSSKSEPIRSSSPMIVPSDQQPSTLASTIQTVRDEIYSNKDKDKDNDKKRKKYRHERSDRSHSKSKRYRSSKDRSIKSTRVEIDSTYSLR